MRQTPAAVLDDGLLDMTVIPDLPMRRIACEAPRLFTGSFLKVPELIVSKSRKILVVPADMSDAYIRTMKVAQWKKEGLVIGKRPCVFLILA